MKRTCLFCCICLLMLLVVPLQGFSAEKVKIGVIVPFTGGLSYEGQETWRGVKLAADMQNMRGGVHGKQIDLVKGDSETLKSAVSEAERLITVEGVKLFCGFYSSSRAKVASTIIEKYNGINWVVTALADSITEQGYKSVFQAYGRATLWGSVSAKFIAEEAAPLIGKKPSELTLAIVHEDSDFGTSISQAFADTAKEYKMKIILTEPYSFKTLDLSSVVLRVKEANPDVLVLTPYVRDGILFLQQARDAKLNPKIIICPGGPLANPVYYEKLGDDMNYMFVTACATHDVKKEAFKPEAWAAFQEFLAKYKKEFGQDASNDALHGFQGAWTFFHFGLPKAKSLDPEDVEKALRTLEIAPGENLTTYGFKAAPLGSKNAGANLIGYANVFQWQKGSIKHLVYPKNFAESKPILPMPPWGERTMK